MLRRQQCDLDGFDTPEGEGEEEELSSERESYSHPGFRTGDSEAFWGVEDSELEQSMERMEAAFGEQAGEEGAEGNGGPDLAAGAETHIEETEEATLMADNVVVVNSSDDGDVADDEADVSGDDEKEHEHMNENIYKEWRE